MQTAESQVYPQELPEDFAVVKDALNQMVSWFRAIICLLCPVPCHAGSSIQNVEMIVQKKADDDFFLETELQDALKESEFWKSHLDAARKHASAEQEASGLIAGLLRALSEAQNLVQKLAAARDALSARQSMLSELRNGALAELEEEIAKSLTSIAQEVLQSDATSAQTAVAVDCNWLSQALGNLPGNKDAPQLILDLKRWQEANGVLLTSRELTEFADRTQQNPSSFDALEFQRLVELLADAGGDALDNNLPNIHLLLPIMMKHVQQKAGWVYFATFVVGPRLKVQPLLVLVS